MTMGIMPITGIPLPFLSYGGSFMWTNMIALGLVLNVGMRRQKIKFLINLLSNIVPPERIQIVK
jgi:rod shape determining protein RodA